MKELKELRIKLGLTQMQMADKLGISLNHYGYIERGSKSPSYKLLRKISETFNIPLFGTKLDDELIFEISQLPEEKQEMVRKFVSAIK